MGAGRGTKRKRPPFGVPREVILLATQDAWRYTFVADGAGGGCGKVAMPSDAAVEDVQAALFTTLADLTRTLHGVDIDVAWSSPTPGSWTGRIRHVTVAEPARADGAGGGG
ncbi:hypothetical protein ABZW32_07775 [Streptomyces sp. NPDC004667]|uniref:hypothetical protein n=1 Tax=Streptomyces sp. NPDC004667 TaxID=3154285 RepID=UPI0033A263E6